MVNIYLVIVIVTKRRLKYEIHRDKWTENLNFAKMYDVLSYNRVVEKLDSPV